MTMWLPWLPLILGCQGDERLKVTGNVGGKRNSYDETRLASSLSQNETSSSVSKTSSLPRNSRMVMEPQTLPSGNIADGGGTVHFLLHSPVKISSSVVQRSPSRRRKPCQRRVSLRKLVFQGEGRVQRLRGSCREQKVLRVFDRTVPSLRNLRPSESLSSTCDCPFIRTCM